MIQAMTLILQAIIPGIMIQAMMILVLQAIIPGIMVQAMMTGMSAPIRDKEKNQVILIESAEITTLIIV